MSYQIIEVDMATETFRVINTVNESLCAEYKCAPSLCGYLHQVLWDFVVVDLGQFQYENNSKNDRTNDGCFMFFPFPHGDKIIHELATR